MANEFIGRKRAVGLGKEVTAGTAVAVGSWIPTTSMDFSPVSEKAVDDSAYGNIDEVYEKETTKNMTEVTMEGILRDDWFGLLLLATFGQVKKTLEGAIGSLSGTFALGETVTGGTSSATGVVRFKEGTTKLYVEVSSGTFTSAETITGGTSGATGTFTYDTAVRAHIFTRLNTNNHPSFTLYKDDDIDTMRCAYGMLNNLDISVSVGEFARFVSSWMAKKMASTTGTPSYSSDNEFMAKHASLYLADTFAGLSGASAVSVRSVNMNFAKNLVDYQALGDDDIASIHNQQFGVSGDLEAIFSDATLRDYMIDSTKKAMKLVLTNDDVTIGTGVNPRLSLFFGRVSFEDWSNSTDLNGLVMQSMGFAGEFDNTEGLTAMAILRNDNTTGY